MKEASEVIEVNYPRYICLHSGLEETLLWVKVVLDVILVPLSLGLSEQEHGND